MDPTTVPVLDEEKSPEEQYAAHILELTAVPTENSSAPPPVTSFEPDIDGYVVSIREIAAAAESSSVRSDRSVPSVIQIPCDDDNNSIAMTKMSDGTVSVTSEAAMTNSRQMSFLMRQTTHDAQCFPVPQQLLQASSSLSSSSVPVAADETWAAGDLFANFVTFVTSAAPLQQQQQLNEEARLQCIMQLFEQMVIAAVEAQCSKAGIGCAEQRQFPHEPDDILEYDV